MCKLFVEVPKEQILFHHTVCQGTSLRCFNCATRLETFQKVAGFVRNAAMVEYSDMLIAFSDGKSYGAKYITLATKG